MIRSMTGYGEAEGGEGVGRLRVEIRTVNHRYLHLSTRGPQALDRLTSTIDGRLRRHLSRGHATVTVTRGSPDEREEAGVEVDLARARGYLAALERIRDDLGVEGDVDLPMLARFKDLFRIADDPTTTTDLEPELLNRLLDEACREVVKMREEEGVRLRSDLEDRLAAMEAILDAVREQAPRRLLAERDRLREAVKELTDGVGVDEDRVGREIAYLAEKWDISEETVRLGAHIEAFRDALDSRSQDPVGKRLGFLVQELLREANTIGSKANDAEIAHGAVALKEEIERLREQVENIE